MEDKQAVKISFSDQHAMMLSKDYETPRKMEAIEETYYGMS